MYGHVQNILTLIKSRFNRNTGVKILNIENIGVNPKNED